MAEKSYPIRKVNQYEVRTIAGSNMIFELVQQNEDDVFVENHEDEISQELLDDPSLNAPVLYEGVTQILVQLSPQQVVPQPIKFSIEGATNIAEAFDKFEAASNEAIEEFKQQAQQHQEAEANKIVTPSDIQNGIMSQ